MTEYKNGAYVLEKTGAFREVSYGDATGDTALQFSRGPLVDSVIFTVYTTPDAAALALQRGDVDYLAFTSGLDQGLLSRLASSQGVRLITNPANGIRYLGFNTRRAPMNNKAFRQAVSVLIDKEFVSRTILQGAAEAAYSMVPPANNYWFNSSAKTLGKGLTREQRVTEAVRLLKAGGFTWEAEPKWNAQQGRVDTGRGMKMPDGKVVPSLEILSPNEAADPLRATFAVWVERWLREIGIPVTTSFTGLAVLSQRALVEQSVDMWILGWRLSIFPSYMRDFFHSSRTRAGDVNMGGFASPEYDRLADTLAAETDRAKAKDVVFQLQEMWADEAPYTVLFTVPVIEPVRTNVKLPFEATLDGIQAYLPSANGPLSYTSIQ